MGMDPKFMIGVRFTGKGVNEYFEALLDESGEIYTSNQDIYLSRGDEELFDTHEDEVVLTYSISWSWGYEFHKESIDLVFEVVKDYCSRFDGGKFSYEIFFTTSYE